MANETNTASQLDKKAAAEAYAKLARGESLTKHETALLKRYERQREEELRWRYYRTIPKKHWCQMSGRQVKVINEQAQRYALPLGGATISLPEVIRALHDFLAKNAHTRAGPDDAMLDGRQPSPALERYREERALLARYERLERERKLVPLSGIEEMLQAIGMHLLQVGRCLEHRFGPEAWETFREVVDETERRFVRHATGTSEFPGDAGAWIERWPDELERVEAGRTG